MVTPLQLLKPRDLELGPLSGLIASDAGAKAESAGGEITIDALRRKVQAIALPPSPWKHWRLARDQDGIAWLVIDKEGASANTLSEDVIHELGDVLTQLENDPPKGLVIRSAKRSGFTRSTHTSVTLGEFLRIFIVSDMKSLSGMALGSPACAAPISSVCT